MGVNKYVLGRTADEVYCNIYRKLEKFGEVFDGRNGRTKELTHVCMSISDPTQRWVVRRKPIISPAFAVAELVMLMNGSDESVLLNTWNPKLPKYQGEYNRYPGAYGRRLRYSFGFDQINRAYNALNNNPQSRQVVLEIWKPDIDLPQKKGSRIMTIYHVIYAQC
jgi:thymidylate synthase